MSVLNSPEELEYATCEIAEAFIQKNAKQQGYAVTRNKLYNDKGQEAPAIAKDKSTARWLSHWELKPWPRGRYAGDLRMTNFKPLALSGP